MALWLSTEDELSPPLPIPPRFVHSLSFSPSLSHWPRIQLVVSLGGFHCESSTSLASHLWVTHARTHTHSPAGTHPGRVRHTYWDTFPPTHGDTQSWADIPSSAADSWPWSTWPGWGETSKAGETLKNRDRRRHGHYFPFSGHLLFWILP